MFTRRVLTLIAAIIVATFTALTIVGSTSGGVAAARIEPCQVAHTCYPYV
jgi:hypothetical protein